MYPPPPPFPPAYQMDDAFQAPRSIYCGAIYMINSLTNFRVSSRLQTTSQKSKMASRSLFNFGSPRVNGFDEVARPFLIGVGGGTASGKVGTTFIALPLEDNL